MRWNWSFPRWSAQDPGIGTVTRVTVETAAWPDAPQEVMAPGHVIEVVPTDSAAEAHAITVDCGTVGSWELLVIPPDESARVATRLLIAAADPTNPLSAPRHSPRAASTDRTHGSRKAEPERDEQHDPADSL